ncbi:centromere/kinetochore protein zw10 homolog isoform X2 [Hydra vulgaris]|uniref:Centromere/kinetochore protein zw10 homolog isoform X2 n=1 Tax=Hydra vulgaris TaxID=6087 RepID=A0ABM4BXU3_HYDVU
MGLVEEIKAVSQKAEHIKATIYQVIHKEYRDVFPSKTQQDLLRVMRPLLKDIDDLKLKFQNEIITADLASFKHKELLQEYNTIEVVTNLLQVLCKCHKELSLSKNVQSNDFVAAAFHLSIVKSELASFDVKNCEIKIFKALRNEFVNQQTKLCIHLEEAWGNLVSWTFSSNASWDSINGHLKTSLKINLRSNGGNINVADLIKAMQMVQDFKTKIKSFSQKLYTYLFKPLVSFSALVPVCERSVENGYHVLKITKNVLKSTKAIKQAEVFKKIIDVVRFVRESLFSEYNKIKEENEEDPMILIGSFIWKDLSEVLIAEHLATALPNTNSIIDKMDTAYIQDTITFELDLIKEGFILPGSSILTNYVKDINVHFANKMCQDILSEARDLMLIDIHNMIQVSPSCDRAAISISENEQLDKKIKNMLLGLDSIQDEFLSVDVFAFPICYISESVQKLVDFIYAQMVKATESQYSIASKIFYSCRDIFELYVNVVPIYHKESLKLPQLAALHYNNCMYLSHHCITLGHQFRSSLPGHLQSALTTFIDYVPVLRRCGTRCFTEQIRSQQQDLMAALDACNSFVNCVSNGSVETIQRAINQVLHVLTRLSKVWYGVLPITFFKKTLAILFDSVLENIISSVLKLEDISAEEAGQLHSLLGSLLERSSVITQQCSDEFVGIKEHVRCWDKFNMLIQMLEASLQTIVAMWDNGEGELAKCMNDGEVRTLVRALFQNTDRRSQALAKIQQKSEAFLL